MRLFACSSLLLLALSGATALTAQSAPPVQVDAQGVMRWTASGEEVALFGVNHTTPFAYAYRAHSYLGVPHREAIDMDVAHLARLGIEAFRVHVWDREISDREGNLLQNDHLDLLDYQLAKLQERGVRTVLTPIFWGGTGYPERNPPTEGFSEDYSKGEMTVNPEARRVQQRYLQQFVQHVNPYTGRSYRDDPEIIAMELFNEPSHPGQPEERTQYINDLARAVRATGFNKPILYNVTIGWSDAHARAVCSAEIQGITFQWYPSGLEVTLNSANAAEGISTLWRFLGDQDVLVGAGTVRTSADVKHAIEAGARFLVSPNFDPDSVARPRAAGVPHLPGVCTATEAYAAFPAGCRWVKLFPAHALGRDT